MEQIVGLGQMVISRNDADVIKTFALASCIGVTAYDAKNKIAGMVHIVLPDTTSSVHTHFEPAYYASTGIPLFISKMRQAGCPASDLQINIYGGACSNMKDCFHIGSRNLEISKQIFAKLNIPYRLADTGGHISRTIAIAVSTGKIQIETLPIIY